MLQENSRACRKWLTEAHGEKNIGSSSGVTSLWEWVDIAAMPLALTSRVIVYKVLVKLLEKKKGEEILPGSDVWTPKWGPPMPHFSFLNLNFFLNDISVIVAGPTRVIMQAKRPYNFPWFEYRKSSWNEKRILVCKIRTFSIATWPNTFISILFLVRKPKSRGMMSLYFKILKIKQKDKELTESQSMY